MTFGQGRRFQIVVGFDPLKTQTIVGYPLLEPKTGIQLMLHRPYQESGNPINSIWKVTEFTTGQRIEIDNATSRAIAATMAIKKIEGMPPHELQQIMSEAPKVNE